jgi:hypothetical protein
LAHWKLKIGINTMPKNLPNLKIPGRKNGGSVKEVKPAIL